MCRIINQTSNRSGEGGLAVNTHFYEFHECAAAVQQIMASHLAHFLTETLVRLMFLHPFLMNYSSCAIFFEVELSQRPQYKPLVRSTLEFLGLGSRTILEPRFDTRYLAQEMVHSEMCAMPTCAHACLQLGTMLRQCCSQILSPASPQSCSLHCGLGCTL